jgi:hypothetical protein
VHLTAYLYLVPAITVSANRLQIVHINKWLTADGMITGAAVDKNCWNRSLLSSGSYRTATVLEGIYKL